MVSRPGKGRPREVKRNLKITEKLSVNPSTIKYQVQNLTEKKRPPAAQDSVRAPELGSPMMSVRVPLATADLPAASAHRSSPFATICTFPPTQTFVSPSAFTALKYSSEGRPISYPCST